MKAWELYPELAEVIRKDHEENECSDHPFEHALMVAQYCLMIAEDERTGELAAIAGLLHNTDRLHPELVEIQLAMRLRAVLLLGGPLVAQMDEIEKEKIITAVLNHHKVNHREDSAVLICLKDADRLANISPFDIIARSARAYSALPLVDPRYILQMDPSSTYRDPKTVFRDAIQSSLEWETWFRLPKAKELARPYFEGLRLVLKLTWHQLSETGLSM